MVIGGNAGKDGYLRYNRSPCCSWEGLPSGKVRKKDEDFRWHALAGLCLALALPVLAWAAPPAIHINTDLLHELRARQALLHDHDLAPLNLGVCVHDHVAVLWGPVPSLALRRRAVDVLKQLPELMEVRDELHVESHMEAAAAIAPVPPPRLPPLPDRSRTPAPSAGRLMKHNPPSPVGNLEWRPADENEPLLPAIAIPRPSPAAADDIGRGDWLIESVTRVQRSESRFRELRVEVRGKTVHLAGTVQRWSDAQDLARRITRLAGVDRVVLGDIRAVVGSP